MRTNAKRPTAGSSQRRATGLGRIFRGSFATRGASDASKGSGASALSRARKPKAVLALVVAVLAGAIFVATAGASLEVFNSFGGNESAADAYGGELGVPRGVDANSTGSGPADAGDIYVAEFSNHRVQRFDSNGNFISAWGKDTIAATVNEEQRIVVEASAGTYTLTFDGSTTEPIALDANTFAVDQALGALPSIGGAANVVVSGGFGSYNVVFQGTLAATNVPQLTADTSEADGPVEIKTLANGTATTSDTGTGYEICTVATECKAGVPSGGDGTAAGNGSLDNPTGLAVDEDTGTVYVADRDNRRINAYDGVGTFLFSVGRDVAEPDGGTEVEICDGGAEVCRRGDGGSGPGEIGSTTSIPGVAVSPPDGEAATGTLYLTDTQNRRVNTYALDGSSPASFGSAATFSESQPQQVAVDSRGIVYASDSENGGEIERYDSQNANGGGVGFLEPIGASLNERQVVTFTGFINNGDLYTLTCPNGETTDPIQWVPHFQMPQFASHALESKCGDKEDDKEDSITVTAAAPWTELTVEFQDNFESTDVPQMTCTRVNNPEAGGCVVTTERDAEVGALLNAGRTPQLGTQGLAVDHDSDAGGPDADVLQVLRNPQVGNTLVQQFGPGNAPGLAAAPIEADDTHGAAAKFGSVSGLGLNRASGELFVISNFGGIIYVLDDPATFPEPLLTLNAVATKTDTTATVTGTVDPQGGLVRCNYQYSTDKVLWTDVPEPDCASLDVDGGPQAVSQKIFGLVPGTRYYVRLTASRPFVPNSTTIMPGARSFETDSVPPLVADVGAIQVQDTSARLVGTVDPRGSATGYVFEYGTTPALGSSTPPLALGSGAEGVTVSQVVSGLKKDTTYYFRLSATNQTGTTTSSNHTLHTRTVGFPPASPGSCPNAERRAEQGSTHLPACRAYEMVSPPDKNQGSAVTTEADYPAAFSADGTGAFFCASAIFGEPAGQQSFTCSPYLSKRGPGGWTTSPPGPRYCNVDPDSRAGGAQIAIPSPESFDQLYLAVPEAESCPFSPLVPGAPLPFVNLYLQDLTTDPAGIDLLSPEPRVTGTPFDPTGTFGVGNRDHSHVVYASKSNQTPDSPPQDEDMKLYDWEAQGHGDCATPGGCLGLLSVRPDGSPFATDTRLPGHDINSGLHPNRQAISDDGERVYFQNETPSGTDSATGGCNAPSCDLYLREGGETTFHVSASECTSECGADSSPDVFQLANPSGEVAFFVSCAKLTDASAPATSGCNGAETPEPVQQLKLYRWDRTAPPGGRLVDLTVDNEPADGVQPGAMDPIGVSDDGDTLFFVAAGQLVAGEPAPATPGGAPEGLKLYRWQWNEGSPSVEYLAPYVSRSYAGGPGGSNGAIGRDPNIDRLHDRVTPDGRYLLVQTVARYDPVADRDDDADLYRWDEQDGWLCVSCQLPGRPSAGHVNSFRGSMVAGLTLQYESREPEHTISDDGQRVFFSASDALVPQDVNGEEGCPVVDTTSGGAIYACQDVYEWHDGTVSLITPGTGGEPFFLMGATHTGNEVFFFTGQRLLGWDQDGGRDVYVAKRNGGFPEPAPQPPECEGEGCREEGTDAPEIAGAGSAVFQGAGNPKVEAQGRNRCPANRLRRGKRCLTVGQLARKRCRRLKGTAKRRCVRKQARRLRRAKRRANRRAQRRMNAHRANAYRRATR